MILKSGHASHWPIFLAVWLAATASLCGAGVGRALGQQSVISATLSGQVLDGDGATVAGAQITHTSLETNQQQTAVSNALGRYRFSYLSVGSYQLTAERAGFTKFQERLTLAVGQALDLSTRLAVARLTEVVNVTDAMPVIETVRTQVSETIAPREIDTRPLNGRNYLDLALLIPGVSRTNTGSNQRFAETSAVPGTGISIAGQRNLNNSFLVDGLSANDDAADLAGTFYSQDVIREFQVITSGSISEFGPASGGVVNIITQSGTNDWRGRLYGFLRNQRLDAGNPLSPRKDPLTQGQYGASPGGPLRRERTFLFTNFAQTRRHDSLVVTITPASVAAINERLESVAYAGPRLQTGLLPAGTLSKAIDDAGNFFFSTPQDNFNLRDDRGLSDNDQRHRLTLSGSLEVPAVKNGSNLRRTLTGFRLSYIFTYGSALPFNLQTGNDRNNDTNNNDRPVGVGRNTGRGFGFASFDLRLSRKLRLSEHVRLEMIAEGFNLLNRANLQLPDNIFGPGNVPLASFGRPNVASDARQFQLGLRFSF